jgi:hypothetical protein
MLASFLNAKRRNAERAAGSEAEAPGFLGSTGPGNRAPRLTRTTSGPIILTSLPGRPWGRWGAGWQGGRSPGGSSRQ